jgi:hypothetical protein
LDEIRSRALPSNLLKEVVRTYGELLQIGIESRTIRKTDLRKILAATPKGSGFDGFFVCPADFVVQEALETLKDMLRSAPLLLQFHPGKEPWTKPGKKSVFKTPKR